MNRNGIKKLSSRFYKFYLVRPPSNANADHLAEQLMGIKSVEEVFVTDGDYGFVVKARFFDGKEQEDIQEYITKRLGGNYGMVTSHYQYKK